MREGDIVLVCIVNNFRIYGADGFISKAKVESLLKEFIKGKRMDIRIFSGKIISIHLNIVHIKVQKFYYPLDSSFTKDKPILAIHKIWIEIGKLAEELFSRFNPSNRRQGLEKLREYRDKTKWVRKNMHESINI